MTHETTRLAYEQWRSLLHRKGEGHPDVDRAELIYRELTRLDEKRNTPANDWYKA